MSSIGGQPIAQGESSKAIAKQGESSLTVEKSQVSPSSVHLPQGESSAAPFLSSRLAIPGRQPIALISAHGDAASEVGSEEAGGQNVYVRGVGEALAKLGWQVDIFTRKTHPDDEAIVYHSPHCRTIRLVAGPQAFIPRNQLFEYMPQFVEAFQKFQSKEGTNYPLVHTNYWLSAWVGLQLQELSNIQLIHTYHSLGAVKYKAVAVRSPMHQTRLAVERQILEQASCVVATSPQERETLHSLVSDQGCIEVVPCGTDLENFRLIPKLEAREQLGLDPTAQIVLYVGRFDPCKGIETLVRAVAMSEARTRGNVRLVMAGGSHAELEDGQERQRIEQILQEVGLTEQTLFPGCLGHDVLPLYYAAADVCVIPSHYEPFGLVAIEAMACGTPVVASDVGGLKFTVIPEETGLLVAPQDTAAFAAAIDRILANEVWATQLKKQASVRVRQNFTWSGVAIELSNLYRRILAQSILDKRLWSVQLPSPWGTEVSEVNLASATPAKDLTLAS
ncbi:glycosyltransferase family 1 protein [Allocoleopsis sp.]|uniref:glycosyltransferase family 4 protein n=1 Tax=Allocoleopsis sp. TaxID=3088169 RepID=UPI002FD0D4C4